MAAGRSTGEKFNLKHKEAACKPHKPLSPEGVLPKTKAIQYIPSIAKIRQKVKKQAIRAEFSGL